MSVFAKLFGGKKQENPQEAVQKLRDLEDVFKRKSDYLEKKIEDEVTVAKENATKNKRVALAALKRKKRYEEQLQQVQGTLTNLEMQRETIENAKTNAEVFRTMNQAGSALKSAHKDLNPDKVHSVMDNFAEQQDLAKEISDAISTPVGGSLVDEDDLEKELAELEQEKLDEELLKVGPLPDLPAVPAAASKVPAAAAASKAASKPMTDEEKELAELAQWAT